MSGVCNQSASIMEQEAGCTRPRSSCSKKFQMEIRKKKLQQDLMLLSFKKKNHIAQLAASIQLVMFFKLIGNHKVLERVLFERSCRFLLCFQTLQWYFYESVVLEGCSTLKEFGLNTQIFILDQFNQHVASKMFSQYQTVHTGAVNKHLILQITNFLLLETI